MSEVNLNIIDDLRAIHGPIHGSVADAVIASLSADPCTIIELEHALGRFIRPLDGHRVFASFYTGENFEPWDAGLVIVDLRARLVCVESSYSAPSPEGGVLYHNGKEATDVCIPYHLSSDWLFLSSAPLYEAVRAERARTCSTPGVDFREVLYGPAMREFIAGACLAAPVATRRNASDRMLREDEDHEDLIVNIHAQWLMTPREDLLGKSPRQLIVDKLDHLSSDLYDREYQWSMLGEPPPALARDSHAYRWSGFGMHEYVVYYDLIRHLLRTCWGRVGLGENIDANKLQSSPKSAFSKLPSAPGSIDLSPRISEESEILEAVQFEWLNSPQSDFGGKIPASVIESERRRIPFIISAEEMMIDENCEMCRFTYEQAQHMPGFWHLDGSQMEDCFEFSIHKTMEEWEAERRKWREFDQRYQQEQNN
jgi:hypothetical protein